jgi:hypothetical protein
MTYFQKHNWIEADYGLVEIRFVVSDLPEGLYVSESSSTQVNIFLLDEITLSLPAENKAGIVENELTFSIDEVFADTPQKLTCVDFVMQAGVSNNKRYCAVFVNTEDIPLSDDVIFCGIVVPEFESEDQIWNRTNQYSTDTNALKTWKITASPYVGTILDNEDISTQDLIDAIDDTWAKENIQDRQGGFSAYPPPLPYLPPFLSVHVLELVSLNKILRKLADILVLKAKILGLGDFNIQFDKGNIDGKWHPARWNYRNEEVRAWAEQYLTVYAKLIDGSPYTTYGDDGKRLTIDPDGNPTDTETIWINFRLFKTIDDCSFLSDSSAAYRAEPNTSSAEEMGIGKRYKTFIELLNQIAICFNGYIYIYYQNSNIHIQFIGCEDLGRSSIYLKRATKSQEKITSNEIDTNSASYKGDAFYLAWDGLQIYMKMSNSELYEMKKSYRRYLDIDRSKQTSTLFTISPTVALIERYSLDYVFPHCHAIKEANIMNSDGRFNSAFMMFASGIHSAIYLNVDKHLTHPDSLQIQPNNYWTPAAKLTVNINRKDYEFDTISDYLNTVYSNNFNQAFFAYEKTLEIPHYYGFSQNPDGSNPTWKCLKLGRKIILDGLTYTITQIKFSLAEPLIKLTLNSASIFDYTSETTSLITQNSISQALIKKYPNNDYKYKYAHEDISNGQFVSLRSDDKIEISKPIASHYGRCLGIAIGDYAEGDYCKILISGEYLIDTAEPDFQVGDYLYLRYNSSTAKYYLSPDYLKSSNSFENMRVALGRAISTRELTLITNPDYAKYIPIVEV